MLTNSLRIYILSTILLAVLVLSLQAQPLKGKSRIELKGGPWMINSAVNVGLTGVETSIESGGILGGIAYGKWLQENLVIDISITALRADLSVNAGVTGVATNNAWVVPILVGVRYYPISSTLESSWRPYLRAGVGPYIGSESKTEVNIQVIVESKTRTAFGGFLGTGLDILLSKSFILGLEGGYNLISDFSEPIGGRKNYSSGEFCIGISLLLGKGVE